MHFRCRFAAATLADALGFRIAGLVRLRGIEVVRESDQHLVRMVAQRFVVHRQRGRFDGAGEVFP